MLGAINPRAIAVDETLFKTFWPLSFPLLKPLGASRNVRPMFGTLLFPPPPRDPHPFLVPRLDFFYSFLFPPPGDDAPPIFVS